MNLDSSIKYSITILEKSLKVLEAEFPSEKSDTFGETIQKISKSQA